jgi:hypothetical protein
MKQLHIPLPNVAIKYVLNSAECKQKTTLFFFRMTPFKVSMDCGKEVGFIELFVYIFYDSQVLINL